MGFRSRSGLSFSLPSTAPMRKVFSRRSWALPRMMAWTEGSSRTSFNCIGDLMRICPQLARLARNERGVALVEFAILLPILLLLFAVTIEGTRMMWSYQTAIAGVRDAARYLGRITPSNVC